jgi:hypothetical protein
VRGPGSCSAGMWVSTLATGFQASELTACIFEPSHAALLVSHIMVTLSRPIWPLAWMIVLSHCV